MVIKLGGLKKIVISGNDSRPAVSLCALFLLGVGTGELFLAVILVGGCLLEGAQSTLPAIGNPTVQNPVGH